MYEISKLVMPVLLVIILASVGMLGMLPIVQAQSDVTQPGDPIVLVNGSNDGDADAWPPPAMEGVEHAIDNFGQKYLNFLDLGSGLAVEPRVGATIVSGLRLYTANDEEPRDPASFLLEGSLSGLAGPWTQIASGSLALPTGRNPGGNMPLGANFQTVSFVNPTRYAAYRLTFPTLKNAAAANSMQIGEVELLGTVALPVSPPNGPGAALSFDGVNDHVVVPGGVWFSGDFTVEGWVFVRSHNNFARLLDFGVGEHNENVVVVLSSGTSGRPLFQVFSGTDPGPTITAPNPLPLNQWSHLACVLSGNTGTIYVNGVAVASGPLYRPPNTARARCYLGRSNWASDSYANGVFDDVRIWNVARTAAQIQQAMRRQLFGNETGLVAYYRFDEDSGGNAFDSTGNPNNRATLVNGPAWIASTIVPFAPTVTTLAANPLTPTIALVRGAVGPNTAAFSGLAYFEWGTNTSFGNLTPPLMLPAFSQPASWSDTLSGLTPCQSYSYRAAATNIYGASFGATLSAYGSRLVITQQPLSQTAVAYHPIALTVGVSALCGGPVTYDWYRVGVGLIPGANESTLTFEITSLADAGTYYVVITDSKSMVTSGLATLTVLEDTQPPVCLGAFGSFELSQIVVRFSERVAPLDAEVSVAYTVNGEYPSIAVLNPDGVSVTLKYFQFVPDTLYTVEICNFCITDLSGNYLSPTNVQFRVMPELNIARTASNRIVVSWLTNFTGYQLESKTNLVPGLWSPVAPSPVAVSSRNVVTNTVSGVSRFYRLRKP